MLSFAKLWELVENEKARGTPLMTSGEGGRALVTARAGKELRGEGEPSFWDDFTSLCGNAEGLAELLGVNAEAVRGWPARVAEALDKLEKQTAAGPSAEAEQELLPTADNGAVTTNSDPARLSLGDVS